MTVLSWILQVLILTAGIHVFLRFVRTTRGNPLIRGLLLSVMVGVVGLWGIASLLRLEELEHILEGSTGFIVVGLAVVFQPELRRAIAQIGERAFASRERSTNKDALRQVAEACRGMAARRDGALICFERETSLRTVVETGSAIGAKVDARLIESLFHPGAALHDGAVVVRENRVVAAGCYLPLSRDGDIDASKGTRHRAALGLVEETDAVVVVVSEETGEISLARDGTLRAGIDPGSLEAELRRSIDARSEKRGAGYLEVAWRALRNDFGWLTASMLLAIGAMYAAHQSIRVTRPFVLRVVDQAAVGGRRTPDYGELLVLPPGENVRVHTVAVGGRFKVEVSGTQGMLAKVEDGLRGTLEVEDEAWDGGPLDLSQVRWEDRVAGMEIVSDRPPELVVERSATLRLQLEPGDVTIDDGRVDPRFQARLDEITFEPGPALELTGPANTIEALEAGQPLELEPIRLAPGDTGRVAARVRLGRGLRDANVHLTADQPVQVVVPVLPVRREAGTLRKDIALVCLSPARQDQLERWALPANAQTARLTIVTTGLIPADADLGSPALLERKAAITRFVEENLRVYADVAELPPRDEGRTVPVRIAWVKDWRQYPEALGLADATLGDWEELDVRLDSEETILLEPIPSSKDEDSP